MFIGDKGTNYFLIYKQIRCHFPLFWHTFRLYKGMKCNKKLYRIAILATTPAEAELFASIVDSRWCDIWLFYDMESLRQYFEPLDIDLTIVILGDSITAVSGFIQELSSLHRLGGDIFVVMSLHSVEVTLSLLAGGVKQCMTLPIDPQRLRRKVYEHLLKYDKQPEVLS